MIPDLPLLDAALAGDEALASALGAQVAPGWLDFPEALPRVRESLAVHPDVAWWGTRFFLLAAWRFRLRRPG